MINNSLVRKIVLVVFLTTLVVMPFVNLSCNPVGLSDSALMCRMQTFTQAKTQLDQIKQLTIAIVNNVNYSLLLLSVLVFYIISLTVDFGKFVRRINFEYLLTIIKPLHSLHFALSRGIIHGKYFD